jgi:adenosine kinase
MSQFENVLVGMGNPLLDIAADVKQEFLDKYEVKLNNAILAEDNAKITADFWKDLTGNHKASYQAAGATQNTIRVCQWMLQEPDATAFFGCVGNDKDAKQLADTASSDGVKVCYQVDKEAETGTCAALINNKERSLVAKIAAANKFTPEFLDDDDNMRVWNKAKFFYVAGFFLTVSPPSILKLAKHALANDKVFSMNLSAPFLCQFFKDPMLATLPYVNFLFGNESEAAAFGEANGIKGDTEAIAVAAAQLPCKHAGGRTVVFTQGADQTIVVRNGKVSKHKVTKMAKEDMVDVNGAGDAFVGGFLAALIKGKDIPDCVEAGHYSAGYIIRRSGTELEGKPTHAL